MGKYALSSEKIKAAAADQIEMIVFCITSAFADKIESPIEQMLLEAITAFQWVQYGRIPAINAVLPGDAQWQVTIQSQIGNYRVDFLIEDHAYGVKVVVECDGHDFHERTKEQAKKDRSRDRELQAMGYLVLRYTGSEIWNDPWHCAEDIERKIWAFDRSRDPEGS